MRNAAAEQLLQQSPSQHDLWWIICRRLPNMKAAWELYKSRAIKEELLEDLLLVNGKDWQEEPLLEFDLARLINETRFKEQPWEQLKKQSPTLDELRSVINECDYDSDYNPLVGAYILECSPGNEDLCFLIEYVDEVQDAAIDMLLKRSPNEKEKALIAKYRS